MRKKKKRLKSKAAAAALHATGVAIGMGGYQVVVKIVPKLVIIVKDEAIHFGLDKTFDVTLNEVEGEKK